MSDTESAPAKILIVDDETASMRALCDTLQSQSYQTQGFTSGREALKTLQHSQFDLLLTDLMMPEMSGVDLLASALKVDPQIVGIIMTGQGTIATAVEAMKVGAFDYVLKPFKLSTILPILSRALAVRQLRIEKAYLEVSLRKRTDELEVANRELAAVNRELESFSFSVSHDLRAPLRAVNGYSRILEKDYGEVLGDEGRELLKTVQMSVNQMGQLIDDLLEFSRAARQEVRVKSVDMTALVRSIASECCVDYSASAVDILDLPSTMGDPALLKQVWKNLLGNALKYSAKVPSPRVEIGGQENDTEVEYWVRDNGAGFDMAYYHKLFSVFQRLHSVSEFTGTGLGLSIVGRIVSRHGGRVWAESKVGEGSIFRFSLPKMIIATGIDGY